MRSDLYTISKTTHFESRPPIDKNGHPPKIECRNLFRGDEISITDKPYDVTCRRCVASMKRTGLLPLNYVLD